MSYKTILVHADASRHAEGRIRLAANLAFACGSHLVGAATTGLTRFVYPDPSMAVAVELIATQVDLLNERLPAKLVVAWGIPHAKIPVYMSAANVLVVTSMQEGSPNVVKEALACDLPVVSVAVGDVPERLRDVEGTELCADERPETIAAALERVLRRGGRVAGRVAVSNLDEKLLTERVIEVYRSVLRDRRSRSIRMS